MSSVAENWVTRHRLSVDEYYRMAEVGLLASDARVELIEGEIIDRAPIGSPHAGIGDHLGTMLNRAVGERAIVGIQRPVRLDRFNEPQPDIVLLMPRADYYKGGHPTAADVLLVVEIAQSSLRYDREIKMPLYARHQIPEAWLIDVAHRSLTAHRYPAGGAYSDIVTMPNPATIKLVALSGVEIDLAGLLSF